MKRAYIKYAFIIMASLTLYSCQYKLFVNKSQILYNDSGYIMFIGEFTFFTETEDTTYDIKQILNNTEEKKTYLVTLDEYDRNKLKAIAKTDQIRLFNQEKSFFIDDSLHVLHINLTAIPITTVLDYKYKLLFSYENRNYAMSYTNFKNDVYRITPTLRNDRIRYN